MTDYYAILGVSRTAHEAEIKRAYRRLAVQYHPDKNPTPEAENLFKLINEAYSVLGDRLQRERYDRMMLDPLSQFVGTDDDQPKHRDPAYRRRRPAPAPFRKRENPIFETMLDLHPFAVWVSRFTFFLSFIFFLDYVLPFHTSKETIEEVVVVKIKSRNSYFFVFTESGKKVKIYPQGGMNLNPGDDIEVEETLLFHTPMSINDLADNTRLEMGYMYRSQLFLPLFLFGFSILGVIFSHRVEFSFNVAIVNGVLLIINFVFL